MKTITAKELAEFLDKILPSDLDVPVSKVTLEMNPEQLVLVTIETTPVMADVQEAWRELEKIRGGKR